MIKLVLVGGTAGTGKTSLGKELAQLIGMTLLDKDTVTGPLVSLLTGELYGNPDDRNSELYLTYVRPLEYRAFINTVWEVLEHGSSVIAVAPFLEELTSFEWCEEMHKKAASKEVAVSVVWMQPSSATTLQRLKQRNFIRDKRTVAEWDRHPLPAYWLATECLLLDNPSGSDMRKTASKVAEFYELPHKQLDSDGGL